MNKRLFTISLFFLVVSLLFSTPISFSGGESSLNLKDGQKSVILKDGARVQTGSITITSDEMSLTGDDWRYVECTGSVVIKDSDKDIEIRSSRLWYDRIDETIIISSWFEIDDNREDLYSQAGSLHYDMKSEVLQLSMSVTLMRISDGEVMKCSSESLTYNRKDDFVSLAGRSSVNWKGDSYNADVISVDLKNDKITLSGEINGTING